jgi:hypothetical protein
VPVARCHVLDDNDGRISKEGPSDKYVRRGGRHGLFAIHSDSPVASSTLGCGYVLIAKVQITDTRKVVGVPVGIRTDTRQPCGFVVRLFSYTT